MTVPTVQVAVRIKGTREVKRAAPRPAQGRRSGNASYHSATLRNRESESFSNQSQPRPQAPSSAPRPRRGRGHQRSGRADFPAAPAAAASSLGCTLQLPLPALGPDPDAPRAPPSCQRHCPGLAPRQHRGAVEATAEGAGLCWAPGGAHRPPAGPTGPWPTPQALSRPHAPLVMPVPPGQAPCECFWPLLTMPCLTIQSLRLFSLPPPIWVREGHAEGGGEARPLVYW